MTYNMPESPLSQMLTVVQNSLILPLPHVMAPHTLLIQSLLQWYVLHILVETFAMEIKVVPWFVMMVLIMLSSLVSSVGDHVVLMLSILQYLLDLLLL